MNVVDTFVTNITKVEEIKETFGVCYRVTADTDCYGRKEKQKTFLVSESDYIMITKKGYYLT